MLFIDFCIDLLSESKVSAVLFAIAEGEHQCAVYFHPTGPRWFSVSGWHPSLASEAGKDPQTPANELIKISR